LLSAPLRVARAIQIVEVRNSAKSCNVIPAKAGIQRPPDVRLLLDSRFRRHDNY